MFKEGKTNKSKKKDIFTYCEHGNISFLAIWEIFDCCHLVRCVWSFLLNCEHVAYQSSFVNIVSGAHALDEVNLLSPYVVLETTIKPCPISDFNLCLYIYSSITICDYFGAVQIMHSASSVIRA